MTGESRFFNATKGARMKVKVIVRYVDRETYEMCDLGEVKEYPKERAEELINGGYVVKYKATEKTK